MGDQLTEDQLENFRVALRLFYEESNDQKLMQIFQLMDTDGNSYLDKAELSKFLKAASGENVREDEVETLLDEADSNKDGKVSVMEFIRVMHNHRDAKT